MDSAGVVSKAIAPQPDGVIHDCANPGNACDDAGDFEHALADCAAASEMDPGFGQVDYERGVSCEHQRPPEQANKGFQAACRLGLRSPDLHEWLQVQRVADEVE